jgi:cytochrome-b5 reductase
LNAEEFRSFKISKVESLTPDTKRYTFEIGKDTFGQTKRFNLPVASFLLLRATIGDKDLLRPYTPITLASEAKGEFQLVVKHYPMGVMTQHLDKLGAGDSVEIKGPFKKFDYYSDNWRHIGMIAGGSGITPMYQVIRQVLNNPNDPTKITLLYSNRREEDIILREELEFLQRRHPDRFKLVLTLTKPDKKKWTDNIGRIGQEFIEKYLPKPADKDIKIMVCGPGEMVTELAGPKAPDYSQGELDGVLKNMGYSKEQVFKF